MEPRLKWNKIILAVNVILFHFRRHVCNEIKITLAAKTILFHFRHGSVLKWNTETF